MNGTTIAIFVAALLVGAGVTAAVRGGVLTRDGAPSPAVAEAADPHAGHVAEAADPHAGHVAEAADPHAGHVAEAADPHAGHVAEAPPEEKEEATPEIPIDPVKTGDVIDLQNEACPVMGGKAKKDVTLDYQGVRVHFCCPGCDKTFEEEPKEYLEKMGITDLDAFKKQHGAGK